MKKRSIKRLALTKTAIAQLEKLEALKGGIKNTTTWGIDHPCCVYH